MVEKFKLIILEPTNKNKNMPTNMKCGFKTLGTNHQKVELY